ncbi:hypothetical protein COJ07_29750 [Bacillus cereus]|uniref:Uncharacterized protein n=1 Tax=Bacillus cereus TaxID=1396 RepID=A0A2B0T6K5_BACCE|nr:hypothetical protein COJ07_29750 [Bacillus cereus]PFU37759.1 hypothetical protein COK86_27740 [Bacillus cereus]
MKIYHIHTSEPYELIGKEQILLSEEEAKKNYEALKSLNDEYCNGRLKIHLDVLEVVKVNELL